jgi:hypothetical protein
MFNKLYLLNRARNLHGMMNEIAEEIKVVKYIYELLVRRRAGVRYGLLGRLIGFDFGWEVARE